MAPCMRFDDQSGSSSVTFAAGPKMKISMESWIDPGARPRKLPKDTLGAMRSCFRTIRSVPERVSPDSSTHTVAGISRSTPSVMPASPNWRDPPKCWRPPGHCPPIRRLPSRHLFGATKLSTTPANTFNPRYRKQDRNLGMCFWLCRPLAIRWFVWHRATHRNLTAGWSRNPERPDCGVLSNATRVAGAIQHCVE